MRVSADWEFCRRSLRGVSRTFSRPIEVLPGDLRKAVTCGYLLCRIIDTVEDNPTLSLAERDALYRACHGVLARTSTVGDFERMWIDVTGSPSEELELCTRIGSVIAVLHTVSPAMRDTVLRWVTEMARGMEIYSHRRADQDGVVAPSTCDDLERYCYFVAGTVGNMLTELFLEEMAATNDEALAGALHDHAESFGTGLQLVNILKDITDDMHRGWSFVPRTLCRAEGLQSRDLVDPARRAEAHRAVIPLFGLARAKLGQALEYALAIPPQHEEIRLFCLLPLWMAVKTLLLAQGNDAMFIAGDQVKVSRTEVEQAIVRCTAICGDDGALRSAYEALWAEGDSATGNQTQAMDAA